MAKTTKILLVTVNDNEGFVLVEYESGTIKRFSIGRIPKTVQTWIDANQATEEPETNPAPEAPEEPETATTAADEKNITEEPETAIIAAYVRQEIETAPQVAAVNTEPEQIQTETRMILPVQPEQLTTGTETEAATGAARIVSTIATYSFMAILAAGYLTVVTLADIIRMLSRIAAAVAAHIWTNRNRYISAVKTACIYTYASLIYLFECTYRTTIKATKEAVKVVAIASFMARIVIA